MSQKRTSTISAKPTVNPDLHAWIGQGSDTLQQEQVPASQHVDISASKQADKEEATLMLSARIPAHLMRKLRIRAATEARPIQEIVADLLREYLGDDE